MARPPDAAALVGGRWIAAAARAYVAAWVVGLAIVTGSPGPTDAPETIGAYFSTHRQLAMLQAYLLDGIAGLP